MKLSCEIRNQTSVLWENVRNIQKIARYIKLLTFIFYVKSYACLHADDNSSLREISKGENKTTTTTTNMLDCMLEVKVVQVTCVNKLRPIQQINSYPPMFHDLLSRRKSIIELSRKS